MNSQISKTKFQQKDKTRLLIIGLVIVVILEVFCYNYRFWESLLFEEVSSFEIVRADGLERIDQNIYKVTDSSQSYIEIVDINREIRNLQLDIQITGPEGYEDRYLPVTVSATDAANELYRQFTQINVVQGITESEYIRLYLNGKTEKIKVSFDLAEGTEFEISDLGLNVNRPFCLHPIRMICFGVVFVIFWIFRPKSKIYRTLLDIKSIKQRRFILASLAFNIMLILAVGMAILPYRTWKDTGWPADTEYEQLTDALIDGHFYLNVEPSETLKQMENPYDPQMRELLHQESGETYLTDYAYYNGKYYCYFGIVPALLFFVPFKLMFGFHLPAWCMVIFCAVMYCVVSYFFTYSLAKRYFKKTNLGLFVLAASVFIAMSSVVYLVYLATVYSVPIILALLLGVTGLTFWLNAGGEKINKIYLVLGALCIALIIGCRPQLAIVLLFAFPIFWNEIRQRLFFSKKGLVNTLCVMVPFFIVGVLVMYYNYARFGSVFDFGANYNLTGNDMTHRGIELARSWLGVFEYLFQPPNVASKFPFLQIIGNNLQTDYQGHVSYEPLFGGFLWFNPICLLTFWGIKYRNKLKRKNVWGISILSLASAGILIFLTIQMSGLTQRYMSDFGWLVGIATLIIIMLLNEYYFADRRIYRFYLKVCISLIMITLLLNYFNIFILGRYGSMAATNPRTLYWVKYVFFTI